MNKIAWTRKARAAARVIAMLAALHLAFLPAAFAQSAEGSLLKDRWFFCFGYKRDRQGVDAIRSLIDVAADHGLNGMVLSSFNLDGITRWNESDISLLREIVDYCSAKKIEWIPTGFSAGYGGAALSFDPSFAAALPVLISLKAEGGEIRSVATKNMLVNGDLEQRDGDRFAGYGFHDLPGQISFADSAAASGQTCIRFENFGSFSGHGRIMQTVAVKPGRAYRFSLKIKTENLDPVSGIKAMVLSEGRSLTSVAPTIAATQDWTEFSLDYINADESEIRLYAGIWQGKSGTFWLDDLRFSEYGSLGDIARRDGAPLELRSRDRDAIFAEGRDFEPVRCLRELDRLAIPPGSSIRDGENLEMSCYKIPYVSHEFGRQISLCMSNPKLYEHWEAEARRLYEVAPYKRFLLSMDEIRNGGGCLLCQSSGLSMAQILGNCLTRQRDIFKAIDPGIEVLTWSDMLDPAHNAHDNYYGVVGDFTGSWNYIPKDLSIMCWLYKTRDESLGFFSGLGLKTYGAAYYDASDLSNPRDWLVSLKNTDGAQGIMYTSWQKKYALLAGFGDLVSSASAEMDSK
ncbi:MAG: hypothetical protein BWZ10_00030 [candidate division BRC1 bacterium ADurb.BinA364]|nr:MAG: hypothetical protein BWZ10_00030 [candidate division BRC1 bacterium ADurb.BinA364]